MNGISWPDYGRAIHRESQVNTPERNNLTNKRAPADGLERIQPAALPAVIAAPVISKVLIDGIWWFMVGAAGALAAVTMPDRVASVQESEPPYELPELDNEGRTLEDIEIQAGESTIVIPKGSKAKHTEKEDGVVYDTPDGQNIRVMGPESTTAKDPRYPQLANGYIKWKDAKGQDLDTNGERIKAPHHIQRGDDAERKEWYETRRHLPLKGWRKK